jgi:germination protein M
VKGALLVIVACLLAAGCAGGGDDATTTDTGTTAPPAEQTTLRTYFLRDGKVWPVAREVAATQAVAATSLEGLFLGPTSEEKSDLGLTTAIPDGIELSSLEIADGVAKLNVTDELTDAALAQAVYTLTQFPTVDAVETGGATYTRADVENFTPAILVESPLPSEEVSSPLRVTGTANTFEATFNYELTNTDGRIVDKNFVTATSGTGTRGTFDFTTKPYTVPFEGFGSLVVFELSAEDGSRINVVEIPLKMSK